MKKLLTVMVVFLLISAMIIGIMLLIKKDRKKAPNLIPNTEPKTEPGNSPAPNNYLFDFFNDDELTAFADNFYTNTPVEMKYSRAYFPDYSTKNTDIIIKVFEALKNVKVGDETDKRITDSEIYYTFVMNDGQSFTIAFESKDMLTYKGKNYLLTSTVNFVEIEIQE